MGWVASFMASVQNGFGKAAETSLANLFLLMDLTRMELTGSFDLVIGFFFIAIFVSDFVATNFFDIYVF